MTATQQDTSTASAPDATVEEKIRQLRELFADAPELGKQALETVWKARVGSASASATSPS
jgi:hypothetical protein